MSEGEHPEIPKRVLQAAGMSVERSGCKVTITASDEFEAELLEGSLNDAQLFAFLVITGAMRRVPPNKSRFHASELTNALLTVGKEPT